MPLPWPPTSAKRLIGEQIDRMYAFLPMPLKEGRQVSFLVKRDAGWERIYSSLLGDVLDSWILDGADRCLMQLWISKVEGSI